MVTIRGQKLGRAQAHDDGNGRRHERVGPISSMIEVVEQRKSSSRVAPRISRLLRGCHDMLGSALLLHNHQRLRKRSELVLNL